MLRTLPWHNYFVIIKNLLKKIFQKHKIKTKFARQDNCNNNCNNNNNYNNKIVIIITIIIIFVVILIITTIIIIRLNENVPLCNKIARIAMQNDEADIKYGITLEVIICATIAKCPI